MVNRIHRRYQSRKSDRPRQAPTDLARCVCGRRCSETKPRRSRPVTLTRRRDPNPSYERERAHRHPEGDHRFCHGDPGAGPIRSDQSAVGRGVPWADAQWARIEPLLPDRTPKWGGRWRDQREVIDAIAFKSQTSTQWVRLPEKYGNRQRVYNRLRMWAIDGLWERVLTTLVAQADADEDLDWAASVDSTIVRAHQHRGRSPQKRGPGRRTGRPRHRSLTRRTDYEDPLVADGRCRPLAFLLTPGQAGDAPAFTDVMARLRVPRRRGRPSHQAGHGRADNACSSGAIRDHLRKRGSRAVIPERADQQAHRKRRGLAGGGRRGTD
ncbi:IS5 family transposase [Streptomyces sp. NPDC005859]|uniref:IS5 family transposase n=1 Tax=Streptomyces sp. NPDC005859 TaxID=3157170 RepID=UPI00340C037A